MQAKRILSEWVVPGIFFVWGLVLSITVINYVTGSYETEYHWSLIVYSLPLVMIPFLFYKPLRKTVVRYLLVYGFGIILSLLLIGIHFLSGEILAAMVGLLIVSVVVYDYFRKQKKPEASTSLFILLVLVGAVVLLVNWLFPNILPYWLIQIFGGFVVLLAIIFVLNLVFS